MRLGYKPRREKDGFILIGNETASPIVMKALRSPWNQNRVPPFSEILP